MINELKEQMKRLIDKNEKLIKEKKVFSDLKRIMNPEFETGDKNELLDGQNRVQKTD